MNTLKKEIRRFIAEKLIYWAICIDIDVVYLFVKKETQEIQALVKEAKELISNSEQV